MAVFDHSAFDDHERVLFCRDAASGLSAIIAIHSTVLGPAAGGCRLWRYESEDAALYDVLRLSQGMSYKNAMANLDFGGGKAVILKTADFSGSEALFEKYGDFVDSLNGSYITAEDVGMSVEIMETIARRTKYVTGLPKKEGQAGGDPSPKTAWGIFKGIAAAVQFKLSRDDLEGLSVAVQGIGHVGYSLCRYLHDAGAKLVVADINEERVTAAREEFGATAAGLDDILFQPVDVVSPCALGAILTATTIPKLRTSIVAGAANNQLETPADGQRLADAGILYAPDYVINAGGIINVAAEYYGNADDEEVIRQVEAIGPRLTNIFDQAAATGRPTNAIADEQARKIIRGRTNATG
ncbi:MAG TPA: Glu/Leu/Phe/Val dehydrogenase dimerization domain-containing protein [Woeseiaceae bacterium]|nr:Glu/Leu/Phe/Val dehydrogenase dimerization domain-containing protein [Woeseiaceae bacterium]